ncbi:MAG: M67 family metallopeptidase, partial [Thermoleophilia bacterium]|nr:M67 family metallopeptidase [Thermoleophilia bacterium]
ARTTDRLVLPTDLYDRLVAFGQTVAPEECCGIGIGPTGEIAEFHPLVNVHHEPVTRYEASAADQLRLYLRADERGWDTTFVFHTHPATEPYPSVTDVALAAWPDAVYAILGLANEQPLLRAYRIIDEVITELPFTAG